MRNVLLLFIAACIVSACSSEQRKYNAMEQCYALKQVTVPKHPVAAGEWREAYTEIHEPLKAYTLRGPTRANRERSILYVVQLGDFDPKGKELFRITKTNLSASFQIKVAELPKISLSVIDAKYRRMNTFGQQLYTGILLDSLLPALLPDSAFALIAFSLADLYPDPEWNFVFGQASLQNRVGVWSMARLGDYNASKAAFDKCLARTIKVATHETGHMFGIQHCVMNECCMNGSNSLEESDRQPSWLCWECLAKVCWNRNIGPEKHLRQLKIFYDTYPIDTAASHYYKRALQLLPPKS